MVTVLEYMSSPYLSVSWQCYHSLARTLASSILKKEKQPDRIVAIARGGLTPGHLLADYLQIPICSITIQSYTDIQKQGQLKITAGLASQIQNTHILVVDDITDSGTTIMRATAYLRSFHPSKITVATLFLKPHAKVKPDYYALKTTQWILQPFEATEWIRTFTETMRRQHKTEEQIKRFLRSLGYTQADIAYTARYYQ